MTPRQSNILKGLSLSAIGLAFGFGSAWIDTKRDIAAKASQMELDSAEVALVEHINNESRTDSAMLRLFRQHADADCVGERNPYRRQLLECNERGIK